MTARRKKAKPTRDLAASMMSPDQQRLWLARKQAAEPATLAGHMLVRLEARDYDMVLAALERRVRQSRGATRTRWRSVLAALTDARAVQ